MLELLLVGLIATGARAIKVNGRMMGGLMDSDMASEFDRLRLAAKTDEQAKAQLEDLARETDYQRGDKSNAVRLMREQEVKIRDKDYEHGVIVNNGKVVGKFTDNKDGEVTIPDKLQPQLNGGIFSHNHPQGSSLSHSDWEVLAFYNAREMRAVGRTGNTYSIRDTKWSNRDFFQQSDTAQRVLAHHSKMDEVVRLRVRQNLRNAGYTPETTSKELLQKIGRHYWHAVNKEVSRTFDGGAYQYRAKMTPALRREWKEIKSLFK